MFLFREFLDNLHLRVEEADGRLDNADGLVVDLAGVDLAGRALEHSGKVKTEVLRVHLGREGVSQGLALASGNGDAIALGGEVAQDDGDLRRAGDIDGGGEGAADNQDLDGLWLLVVDVENGAGGVAVDELDAEDLCLREGGGDVDVNVGGLLLVGVLDLFLDCFDLEGLLVGVCWFGVVCLTYGNALRDLSDRADGVECRQSKGSEFQGDHVAWQVWFGGGEVESNGWWWWGCLD